MWWLDEEEEIHKTYDISDQFLIGDRLLVAPVIEKGATSRSVYLPAGLWVDGNNNNDTTIQGPTRIIVKAPLNILPFFERAKAQPIDDASKCTKESFSYSLIALATIFTVITSLF